MSASLAAVDVGGTFTDIAAWEPDTGLVRTHKLLTTASDPSVAIAEGLRAAGLRPGRLLHATTLVTNALIERRGARTGLITTDGHRDVLEIGTELRYDTFDLLISRPTPLVPRHRRIGVQERVASDGTPVLDLDEEGVRAAGRRLRDEGVEAVAVAFMNSYANGVHEQRAMEVLASERLGVTVCGSAHVSQELREYERFSTAVGNAYVQPLMSRYLADLGRVVGAPLLLMLSDGTLAGVELAIEQPIRLVESGPAAGAMAVSHLARRDGRPRVLAFDMGGTTAKISLVRDGIPQLSRTMEVARVHRHRRGSGLPVRVPVIELIEIGAGGGSIASVGPLGLPRVGPTSAGASPGPACYGKGGTEPTVTDADLVLGYLPPSGLAGGTVPLTAEPARAALSRLARDVALGDVAAAAAAVARVVDNDMATAARIHLAEHGEDPLAHCMIAFGGAGPVHAYSVARLLGVREVVFPAFAGVASAVGMLVTPPGVERVRTLRAALPGLNWRVIKAALDELREDSRAVLMAIGVAAKQIRADVLADMRYVGQGHELAVPIDGDALAEQDPAALARAFERHYELRYGRSLEGAPVEVLSWRVRAQAKATVSEVVLEPDGRHQASAASATRHAYFSELERYVEVPVHSRAVLRAGQEIVGPALVEQADTTVVVGPAAACRVTEHGDLVMTIEE